MPKVGPDKKKLLRIRDMLKKHPEGLWIREIARKSGVDKSTVSRYLSEYMGKNIEIRKISKLVKIVKLKGR